MTLFIDGGAEEDEHIVDGLSRRRASVRDRPLLLPTEKSRRQFVSCKPLVLIAIFSTRTVSARVHHLLLVLLLNRINSTCDRRRSDDGGTAADNRGVAGTGDSDSLPDGICHCPV